MAVTVAEVLNRRELRGYVARVGDRWPLAGARIGGARIDDLRAAGPQRERGPEFVVVLVSDGFDGVPWLERVHQCGSLWDAAEMGARADVHCYTPNEYERKRAALPVVAHVHEHGLDLMGEGNPPGWRPGA